MRLSLIAAISCIASVATADVAVREGANHHLGDDSFVTQLGREPSPIDTEHDRMQVHLRYVREMLAGRAATLPALDARRAELLGYLDDYIAAGITPHNTYVPWRNPVFIDADGRICAVGYLIERSTGRALPERIAASHRLDYLEDIAAAMPEVAAWVASSGLTLDELASIQPGYMGPEVQHLAGWRPDDAQDITTGAYHQETEALVVDGAFDDKKQMTGPWKVATKAGKLVGSGSFKKGAGTWTSLRPDGTKLAEGPFTKDRAEGEWKFFHASGNLAGIGNMHKGKRSGSWTFYYDAKARQITSTGRFEDGELVGTWRHYDAKGTLVATSTGRAWNAPLVLKIAARDGVRREVVQGEPASAHAIEGVFKGSDKLYIRNHDSMLDAKGNVLDKTATGWTATSLCWKAAKKRAAADGDVVSVYSLTMRDDYDESAKGACTATAVPVDAELGKRYDALLAARKLVNTPAPKIAFDDVSRVKEDEANADDSTESTVREPDAVLVQTNDDDMANYLADHMNWYMEWPHVDGQFIAVFRTLPGYTKHAWD